MTDRQRTMPAGEQRRKSLAYMETENMTEKLDEYQYFMSKAIRESDKCFYNDDSLLVFDAEMKELREFFYERETYLNPILNSYID